MPATGIINDVEYENAKVAFTAAWNAIFPTLKAAQDAIWDQIATTIPMGKKTIDLKWISDMPVMREWLGERQISELAIDSYQVTARRWANGIKVTEEDIEDDDLGMIPPRIRGLASMALLHKLNEVVGVLIDGFSATPKYKAYDGQPLFSASHKHMGLSAAQGNIVTGEPSLDDSGAFDAAMEKISTFVDANGEPLNMEGTLLLCGPKYRTTVKTLLGEHLASGATNPNHLAITPVISRKLIGAYANYWFVIDGSKGVGPVLWGLRRAVKFRVLGGLIGGQESEMSFKTGDLLAGADYRGVAVPGLWETIVGSRGTA